MIQQTSHRCAELKSVSALHWMLTIFREMMQTPSAFTVQGAFQGHKGWHERVDFALQQVTLTVRAARGGGNSDVTLTRQPIQYQPVTSELCGSDGSGGADSSKPLGYIRVATFSKQTPDAVRDAIRALKVLHSLKLCRSVQGVPHTLGHGIVLSMPDVHAHHRS